MQGVVGRGLSFACAYLGTILLARQLGPVEYGVYGVVISVLLWIEQTGRFTIPPAAAKLIPEDQQRSASVGEAALTVGLTLFILLFALLWLAAPALAELFALGEGGATLFRIAAIDLPLFGIYAVYRGVVQGHRDFLALSVADVVHSAAKLIAIVALFTWTFSVGGALLANVVASLCALLYLASRMRIAFCLPSADVVRPLIRLGLPLGLYMLGLQTITNLDLWSLTVMAPDESASIGVYVAARNLAVVPGVVLMVVSDIVLPSLSRAVAMGDAPLSRVYIQGAVRFLSILIAPIALTLMLGADHLMAILYSQDFAPGGAFVRILVVYAVALPFVDLFASALSARGEPYRGGLTLLVIIPLTTVLNVVLIRSYGPIGAAYGSAIAGLLSALVLGLLVVRRFGPLLTTRTFRNVGVATLLMVAATRAGADSALALTIVSLLVYGVALAVLRELTREDLAPLAFWKWGFR